MSLLKIMSEIISKLSDSDDVISVSPYIETQGLMSAKNRSRGVFVTGINAGVRKFYVYSSSIYD